MNREEWLNAAVKSLSENFKAEGHDLPEVKVSMGWPHGGKASTIGQCWHGNAATDGIGQIFISPILEDTTQILAVLLHELVHAVNHAAGDSGHGKPFAAIAKPLGLVGKMTSTTAGDHLAKELAELAIILGEFPHSALNPAIAAGPSRSGKTFKLVCAAGDDFKVSMAKSRFLAVGAPICPCHNEPMEEA